MATVGINVVRQTLNTIQINLIVLMEMMSGCHRSVIKSESTIKKCHRNTFLSAKEASVHNTISILYVFAQLTNMPGNGMFNICFFFSFRPYFFIGFTGKRTIQIIYMYLYISKRQTATF
jgi:hypothetical protein